MTNPGIPHHEVAARSTTRFLGKWLGLTVKLGVIAILIWAIAQMPPHPVLVR